MIYLTGKAKIGETSGLIRNYPMLGWLFFISMLSLTGIPPLSGFIGKVYIGQGAIETGSFILLAATFLSGIFVLYSLLRIFLNCFWGETIINEDDDIPFKKGMLIPCVLLAILTVALGIGAEGLAPYVSDAARTLMNPEIYIEAVLQGNR